MNGKTRNPVGDRSAWRRIALLALAVAAAIGVYTAAWYHAAGRIEAESDALIAEAAGDGILIACENSRVAGYPFRLGLFCDRVGFENRDKGIAFSAGAFRSASQVYDPSFLIGELDGTGRFALPALEPVRLDWEQLRASIRYSEPLPDRLSMEGRRISGTTGTDTGPLFEVARGELHFRPNGPDIDLALSAIGVWVAPRALEGAELPPLDAEADISLGGGVAFVDGFAGSLRGMRGTIRTLRLASGKDISVSASGTFSVGADGAVEAELSVTIVNAARIGEVLAAIVPERADAILNVSAGIAFFGERAEFPLTVKSGRAYLGPFEIGRVAPLP